MFQFSMGFVLADYWKTSFYVDIIDSGNHNSRDTFVLNEAFLLPNYSLLDDELITHSNLGLLKFKFIRKRLPGRFGKLLAGHEYLATEHTIKPLDIFNLFKTKPIYISGYWQSAAFTLAHREQIRRGFTFRESVIAKSTLNKQGLCGSVSRVAVHIRRGDFITSRNGRNVHGACSTGYYIAAINHLKRTANRPLFLFFSDDIEWVKSELIPLVGDLNYKIQTDPASPQYIDLYNMSICDHHILSNSTFSWWGWWLSSSLEKNGIVVAPDPWNVSNKFDYLPILHPSFTLIKR